MNNSAATITFSISEINLSGTSKDLAAVIFSKRNKLKSLKRIRSLFGYIYAASVVNRQNDQVQKMCLFVEVSPRMNKRLRSDLSKSKF